MLNSKSEFNKCALPMLGLKMGEKEFKEKRKDEDEDMRREEEIEQKIKEMKKDKFKKRRTAPKSQPDRKRMRLEDGSGEYQIRSRREEKNAGRYN